MGFEDFVAVDANWGRWSRGQSVFFELTRRAPVLPDRSDARAFLWLASSFSELTPSENIPISSWRGTTMSSSDSTLVPTEHRDRLQDLTSAYFKWTEQSIWGCICFYKIMWLQINLKGNYCTFHCCNLQDYNLQPGLWDTVCMRNMKISYLN